MRWRNVREVMKTEVAEVERFIEAEEADAFHARDRAWADGAAHPSDEMDAVDAPDASNDVVDACMASARPA